MIIQITRLGGVTLVGNVAISYSLYPHLLNTLLKERKTGISASLLVLASL